jgi:hypothetical protein
MLLVTEVIKNLKRQFRIWCGMLSIREIMSNRALADTIESIEMLLQKIEAELSQGKETA